MADNDGNEIDAKLEELSEALLFTEPDDMTALGDLRSRLLDIAERTKDPQRREPELAAQAASKLLEAVLGEKSPDPSASLDVVGRLISVLQAIFRDGRAIDEVEFPEELSIERHDKTPQAATAQAPAAQEAAPQEGAAQDAAIEEGPAREAVGAPLTLPAYVDEAIMSDFLGRQGGVLEEMDSQILELERSGSSETFAEFRRLIHTLKGESGMLGLTGVEKLCHATEDALDSYPIDKLIDSLFGVKDWCAAAFEAYEEGHHPVLDASALLARLKSPDEGALVALDIASHLDSLSVAFDGVASTNMTALAAIHTVLEQLAEWCKGKGLPQGEATATAMTDTVTDMILEELDDPEGALAALRATAVSFRAALLDDGSLDENALVGAPQGETPSEAPEDAQASGAAAPPKETPVAKSVSFASEDKELVAEFVNEANEHLEAAEVHLLTLETSPRDEDAINAVFRGFHTIKGVAGFMALADVQSLAHEAETLLDKVRKDEIALEGPVIDIVFEAVDSLKNLIANVSTALTTGDPLAPEPSLPPLLARIQATASGQAGPEVVEDSSITYGRREDDEHVPLGDILVERRAASRETVDGALKQQAEPLQTPKLGEVLVDSCAITRVALDQALESQKEGTAEGKIGEVLVASGATTQGEVKAALDRQKEPPTTSKLGEILVRSGEVPAQEVARALREQKTEVRQGIRVKESVKVDAERLDGLVDMIGELVIAESMVSMSPELTDGMSQDLGRHVNQLTKITRELQEMGTTLRMVPVRATFQKMARLVRDLAKKSGKKVDFSMTGEETELDKSLVDKIGDPLVHMVRNAVDHGLEATTEDRIEAGKSPAGHVELRAFHRGGNIYVEIEDDGRGLDREAILAKARERGLIGEDDVLEDREVWNLIFEAGFSTAKTVTDVSGRGVGMDVVRRNIQELRGHVEIRSEQGKGSVFSLRLPLTLAIIDGMVIRCGSQRFVIPTLSVQRLISPEDADFKSAFQKGEMLMVQGNLVPLFFLDRLFDISDSTEDRSQKVVIVVENEQDQVALMVDEVLGQQQTVIKPLGETFGRRSGVVGAAIMPDGLVGLILDVGGLIALAHEG